MFFFFRLACHSLTLIVARHNDTGKLGESLAVRYFAERGFEILHQNWRHKHWEVDIIATKENTLHFIEVKTRRGSRTGNPEDNNHHRKIGFLMNAADEFTHQNPGWKRLQFDLLAITLHPDGVHDYFLIEDIYL